MTSLDNLEKLIQMATIEHMYSMLQKISNKSIDTEKQNYTESSTNTYATTNTYANTNTNTYANTYTNNDEIITRLNSRVNQLETEMTNLRLSVEEELTQLRSNTNNNSKYLCQQIRGQQVLTSYPGFSTSFKLSQDKIIDEQHIVSLPTSKPFANIVLKIEEKIVSELDTLVLPEELKSLEE